MIEFYSFGRMKINGFTYSSDLIIFNDHVKSDWWRVKGHRLHVEDLDEFLRVKPEILVVGTGYFGLMEITPETRKHLQEKEIMLLAEKTGKAYKTFNQLSKSNRVVGAFHLTC